VPPEPSRALANPSGWPEGFTIARSFRTGLRAARLLGFVSPERCSVAVSVAALTPRDSTRSDTYLPTSLVTELWP